MSSKPSTVARARAAVIPTENGIFTTTSAQSTRHRPATSRTSTATKATKVRRGAPAAGLLAAGMMLVAACGGGTTKAATPAAQASVTSPPAPSATVSVRATALGQIVVDGTGRTLYRFDKDTVGSATSACNGACATTWPPAQVNGQPTAGAGVVGALGVITRNDGSHQVTLDGHPLYDFSGDQASGDTNGNGFGGIWHVLPASGGGAQTASAGIQGTAPATMAGSTPYGY